MADATNAPWAQLPDESNRHFEAFCAWLAMDPAPSGGEFARRTNFKYGKKRSVERWTVIYNWKARRAARDEYESTAVLDARRAAKEAIATDDALTEYRNRMVRDATTYRQLASVLLRKVAEYLKDMNPSDMTPGNAASIARAAKDMSVVSVELEAAALGVDDILSALARGDQNLSTSDTTDGD